MISATLVWVVGCGVVLAVGSAVFSAFETALFSLQSHEIDRLRRHRARDAEALLGLLAHPRRLLSAIVMGDVILNIPLMLICLYLLSGRFEGSAAFWLKAFLVLGIVVFVCDLFPKIYAFSNPYLFIRPAVKVLHPLMRTFERPLRFLQRLSDGFADGVTLTGEAHSTALGEAEMRTLMDLGVEDGALHRGEAAMVQEIIRLGRKTARDCMTPRVDAVCVPDDWTNEQMIQHLSSLRYRRVPVYGETPDDILGILDVRAFLENPSAHYTELLSPPSFIPETFNALALLRSFLRRPQGLAIVVDEFGGTEGVITRADLVEEILSDALPVGDRDLYIEALGEGRFLASGSARLEDLSVLLDLPMEFEGIDTVGGWVFNLAGQLPKPGAVLEQDGVRVSVRRTSRKRVEEVLVERGNNAVREEDAL